MSGIILEQVGEWIKQHTRIQHAPLSNGGWERWAQIDFSIYLVSNGWATITEDPCFAGNTQKADLVVLPLGPVPGAVMELKVLNNTETIQQYKTKLGNDTTKLQQPLKQNRAGYIKCSYGIASYGMLLPELQNAFPGQNINQNNYIAFLELFIPTHSSESETSASGDLFAVSFLRVP